MKNRIAMRTVKVDAPPGFRLSPERTKIYDVDSGEVLSASADAETETLRYRNFLSGDFPDLEPADPEDLRRYPPVGHPVAPDHDGAD